ncbi:hypothetical protein KFL_003360140 [Klebsormidium nitens]|uniref:Uncharacterized protein n=1 Tax=Klebsormidium nitens TaxID=105231 RepID=A0A1Y1IB45_KLENI|nr:hypothetical protein KFL_003360140 [Klebsormidium nitens]|eukprot:GAQ87182.1 hypothetical protein KFL_003360140 [Klebsormidium nitens]
MQVGNHDLSDYSVDLISSVNWPNITGSNSRALWKLMALGNVARDQINHCVTRATLREGKSLGELGVGQPEATVPNAAVGVRYRKFTTDQTCPRKCRPVAAVCWFGHPVPMGGEDQGQKRRARSKNDKFLTWLRGLNGKPGTSPEGLSSGGTEADEKMTATAVSGGKRIRKRGRNHRAGADSDSPTPPEEEREATPSRPPSRRGAARASGARNKIKAAQQKKKKGKRPAVKRTPKERDSDEELEAEARQRRKRTRRAAEREEGDKPEPLKRPRLTVSLTKREIIEDFVKITGKKPSLKPKKNPLEQWGIALGIFWGTA